ncbi:MAG: hypothetical protein ACFFC9_15555 [Promethearchaeota archaeon]
MRFDSINIAVILLLITVAGLMMYAFTFIIFGGFNLLSGFSYIGKTEAEILAFDPTLHVTINTALRTLGFTDLALGELAIFVIVIPFRKKEKWAWISTFIVVLIFTLPILIIQAFTIGLTFYLLIIFIVIQIAALGITFKDFFKKE